MCQIGQILYRKAICYGANLFRCKSCGDFKINVISNERLGAMCLDVGCKYRMIFKISYIGHCFTYIICTYVYKLYVVQKK